LAEPAGLRHCLRFYPAHSYTKPHRLLGRRICQLLHHGAHEACHERPYVVDAHDWLHCRRPGRRYDSRHRPHLRWHLSGPYSPEHHGHGYALKVGYEVIATPLTYLVIHWLKRTEHSDAFDRHQSFNPFSFAEK